MSIYLRIIACTVLALRWWNATLAPKTAPEHNAGIASLTTIGPWRGSTRVGGFDGLTRQSRCCRRRHLLCGYGCASSITTPGVVGLQFCQMRAGIKETWRVTGRPDSRSNRPQASLSWNATPHWLLGRESWALNRATGLEGPGMSGEKPESEVTWTANPRRVTSSPWHRPAA